MAQKSEKIKITDSSRLEDFKNMSREIAEQIKNEITKENIIKDFCEILDPDAHEAFKNHINNVPDELIEEMGKGIVKHMKKLSVYYKLFTEEKKVNTEVKLRRETPADDKEMITEYDKLVEEVKGLCSKVIIYII
jgi:hypothetical protein